MTTDNPQSSSSRGGVLPAVNGQAQTNDKVKDISQNETKNKPDDSHFDQDKAARNPASQAIDSHAEHSAKDSQLNQAEAEKSKQDVVDDDSFADSAIYPWKTIGSFNEGKAFDTNLIRDSNLIKTYIIETFSSDWYWNTGLIIGTCFFSWLFARFGFSIFGLIFVLLCSSSVYRAEFRRFERNVRDDLQRIASAEHLEKNFESMEWLNSFLVKFWVIYMPALSDTVRTIANDVLKDVAPGYGIDALTLDEFTLGTKAPRIDSIKSYTKLGKDIVEMDWAFSFTPDDTSDMTKREIDRKIDPKVALGVRVGKGFVSKRLPILVEHMNVSGRMKVRLDLSLNFPHIKTVSVQFLEAPKIDFSLKPVGGDTFGLDVMSLVPGLKSLIMNLVNANVGPMLYAPNHLDIDVEALMAEQANDAIGVVAVTVHGASELKATLNPYVQMSLDKSNEKPIHTEVKAGTKSPQWAVTKYILVNTLQQKLKFELFNFNISKKKGELYASHEFELADLIQHDSFVDVVKKLEMAGKKKGLLNYDIRWFPVLHEEKTATTQTDESKEVEIPDSEVGVLKFTLHQAKKLDHTASIVGVLNASAELFFNDQSVKKYRTLKRTNEPSWEESMEVLISQKSATNVKLVLTDSSGNQIAQFEETLETILFNVNDGSDNFEMSPQGQVRLTATWKPVSLSGVSAAANYIPAIGVARLHVRNAVDLLNLETVGKVDPYVKVLMNNRLKFTTGFHPDTLEPEFEEVVYLPLTSASQHITLEVMDEQKLTKDRTLGSCNIAVSDFIKRSESSPDALLFHDGSNEILSSHLQIRNKRPKGTIFYSMSFIPSIPVLSVSELAQLKEKEAKEAEEKKEHQKQILEWEDLYKKHPKEYEWVEVEEKDESSHLKRKERLSLDQLLTYRSGTIGLHINSGKVSKADTFIQFLVDDSNSPSFITSRTSGRSVNPEVGDLFIRDLPNSKLIVRVTKKPTVKNQDQIIEEKSFNTIDILQKSFAEDHLLSISGGSSLKITMEYIPTGVKLPPSETVLDCGRARVEFLDAQNLMAGDSNGKSDPYAELLIGDVTLFKTKIIKKTLNPTWNEGTTVPVPSRSRNFLKLRVYDWDRAGKNDLLGVADFDISSIKPLSAEIVTFQLDTQGTVRCRVTFTPEYIRPQVGEAEFGASFASLTGAPLKAVGAVGDLAGGVVGGGVNIATNVVGGGVSAVGKGGSLFKSVFTGGGKSNSSRKSIDSIRDSDAASIRSTRTTRTKASNANLRESNDASGAVPPLPNLARTDSSSQVSTFSQAMKGRTATEGSLTIRSATGLGDHAQLKVSLAIRGKLHELAKTKTAKSSNGVLRWDESVTFDAPKEAEIIFGGLIKHKFAKDEELGTAKVKLIDAVDNPRDMELNLGSGQIVVSFRYSPEADEAEPTPPPVGW
ncbi:hypothetical protein WICPIJ_008904 [Wickerhamomyces pijperi]|uniref:Tricalbin n=1 Tax=Wickerhamomyces pijperi TaxID=599730 RepID=A0A9P8TH54_WICPI|nr:hypothetical protein WICPIJ_008904 [Wickerhamomyces pijperi]